MEDSKICHEDYQRMLRKLQAYYDAGILLTLKGEPSSPKRLAYECAVREKDSYMSDYIPDSKGRLREIRFDYIRGK